MVKKKEELKVPQHKHRSEIKASSGKEQCALLNVRCVLMHLLRFTCRRCVGVLGMSPVFQGCDTGEDK